MDYQALLARIYQSVDSEAYFAPSVQVPQAQRAAMAQIGALIRSADFSPDEARALTRRLHQSGRIDRIRMLSALHVIEAHPSVGNWDEAARLVAEQEMAVIAQGGPRLQTDLAAVERHRGVLAYLNNSYELALDYFSRALERERSAENLQNVLCTMLRLGEEADACSLLRQIRQSYPDRIVSLLDQAVETDPDLALLR